MLDRTTTTTETRVLDEVLIDELGALRARKAELELAEKELKKQLAHLPAGAYEGRLFRLAVIESTREGRDDTFKAKIEELVEEHLSRQYIVAHTTSTDVRTLKTSSRNGKGVLS